MSAPLEVKPVDLKDCVPDVLLFRTAIVYKRPEQKCRCWLGKTLIPMVPVIGSSENRFPITELGVPLVDREG